MCNQQALNADMIDYNDQEEQEPIADNDLTATHIPSALHLQIVTALHE